MSIKILDYILETDEYLVEKWDRELGKLEDKISSKNVSVFADIGTVLGMDSNDNKYYFIKELPAGVTSMIVDSIYESEVKDDDGNSQKVVRYKIETSYEDDSIQIKYLTERDAGEALHEGDFLEYHSDCKFYIDHKATYEAKNRVAIKFAMLHKKTMEAK